MISEQERNNHILRYGPLKCELCGNSRDGELEYNYVGGHGRIVTCKNGGSWSRRKHQNNRATIDKTMRRLFQ